MAALHCQKCRTPLKVDSSLQDLNPASFKILADAAPALEAKAPDAPRSAAAIERRQRYDDVSQTAGSAIHRRNVSASQRSSGRMNPDMSYIDVTASLMAPEGVIETPSKTKKAANKASTTNGDGGEALSRRMETVTRLFDILSARSDIDLPICSECTELVLDGLQKRQTAVIRERDAYVEFLKQAQQDVPTDEEVAKTRQDLETARQREKEALEELIALEAEKARMEDEIALLDAEADALDEEEEAFWRERNTFTAELTAFQQERDSLQSQLAHDTKLLESLQRTNVYNDTFVVGHDGVFGTINGLRLGRLNDHPVEWPEINAALGQALLLLVVVAEKLGYKFKGYTLHPVGSTSRLILTDPDAVATGAGKAKNTVLDLYSSGSFAFGITAFMGSFDNAMIALLECVRQVGDYVEQTTASQSGGEQRRMPYEIQTGKDMGKIGGVKIGLNGVQKEEQWTKACKYLLTCSHASHVANEADSRGVGS
ncbi:Vacuolar protein sorting-associated protein atg6 [Recurvomyces mirabilis]|uniref:Vacuolar protein sorting-associated protein atg6 n=1 Tax=Recurvomyces mirabilis TaxID=574656 RepID=A0AAE0TQA0_9PEZI|nr:Vacuolar protein sorting-associated protein atg6 [Recurvomyces mirabilis]KAK5155791.1 Vacuolar protein sorting-associated protein atg6 [Recurvomyces mirabilis]